MTRTKRKVKEESDCLAEAEARAEVPPEMTDEDFELFWGVSPEDFFNSFARSSNRIDEA